MSGRDGTPDNCHVHKIAASGGEVDSAFLFDLHEAFSSQELAERYTILLQGGLKQSNWLGKAGCHRAGAGGTLSLAERE